MWQLAPPEQAIQEKKQGGHRGDFYDPVSPGDSLALCSPLFLKSESLSPAHWQGEED